MFFLVFAVSRVSGHSSEKQFSLTGRDYRIVYRVKGIEDSV